MIRKVFMEQTLHIKNLKIKKGELILRLSRPEKAIQLQASIVFQNTGFHFSHPVELLTDNSSEMVLKIDVSFLEQNDGDVFLPDQSFFDCPGNSCCRSFGHFRLSFCTISIHRRSSGYSH